MTATKMPRRRSKHRDSVFTMRTFVVLTLLLVPLVFMLSRDDTNNDEDDVTPRRKMKADRNAIVSAIRSNNRGDLENMCRALGSLTRLPDHGATPVLIYSQTQPLDTRYQSYLRQCANQRALVFPIESARDTSFWISKVFNLESIVSNYDVIMRLDCGACWKRDSDILHLPGLPNSTISYHAGTEARVNRDACGDMMEFASNYIVENHVIVQNPHLWYDFEDLWIRQHKCIAYQTHFEVMRVELMKQDAVQQWLQAATKHEPKWDDQLLRAFTMVMFASGMIPPSKAYPIGYSYNKGRPGSSCKALPGAALEAIGS